MVRMRRLCVFGMSDNLGGTEVYLMTLYRELRRRNADIQFDFLLRHEAGVVPYEKEILELGGRLFREYYTRSERRSPGYLPIETLFDRHLDWCGVYLNVQNIHTAYRLVEEAAKRKLPYRLIHAHNSGYERKPTAKEKLYEIYFHQTVRRSATALLACSKEAGQWMFRGMPFTVIPDAVDFSRFYQDEKIRKKVRNDLQIADETVVMGFCGRLAEQKNPLFLLDIFEKFRQIEPDSLLLIVGDGELEKAVRKKIREQKLDEKVILTGSVTDVNPYLQAMDCFVFPSRYEGFGIALLEAQAAGLRCYTTDQVVPGEVNQTGRVTFIQADVPAAEWAGKIQQGGYDREDCQNVLEKCPYSTGSLYHRFMQVLSKRKVSEDE